jgi:hypothetical protein
MTKFFPDSPFITAAQKAMQAGKGTSVGGGGGSVGFSYKFTNVRLYRPVLDMYLNSTSGEVGKYLKKRGRLIVSMAKRQVGVETGRLKESINMVHERVSRGQQLRIGSSLDYALMHHEGTQPHIITPQEAGILRFSSGGRIIYTHKVDHPGTRPNRYLSDQLWVARI